MKILPHLLPSLVLLLFIGACTPKATAPITTTEPTPTVKPEEPEEPLSPCAKFSDAPNPDDAETNYVLYRDFLRVKNYDEALKLWRKVINVAPAADGRRNTVLADGIRFYEYYGARTEDEALKERYVDSIFLLYDKVQECYAEGGYVAGRKAFDYFYKYTDRKSDEEVWNLFKESMDTDGMDAQYFIVNPMASLLVKLFDAGKIVEEEANKYALMLLAIVEKGVSECEGKDCERWKIIEGYTPVRLEYFETIRGFYDCDYYVDKYYQDFQENPEDCDVIRTVFSRLRYGNCPEDKAELTEVAAAGQANCVTEAGPLRKAYDALQNGNYRESISLFEEAVKDTDDAEKKGKYLLLIAKIYYSHLKNFSQARSYARRAAEARSGWGEPYLLIGRLYASSGPLCGPGRGWDSQIVVWPAIDMWNRAKQIDPAAAAEANKWIGRYRKFMPNKEDVFIRNLAAGQSFYVGCWIKENTTIRTSN